MDTDYDHHHLQKTITHPNPGTQNDLKALLLLNLEAPLMTGT